MLKELQEHVRTIADTAGPSVVSIGRNGRGTGFVVATDRVLTSSRNLRDKTVSVTFADGRTEQARVHGLDGDGDLAVVEVPTGETVALAFAEAETDTGVGTPVVALSRGGHRPRATIGFVSAVDQAFRGPRGRAVRGGLEHTAPLARGSSGGPVFDGDGRGGHQHPPGGRRLLPRAGRRHGPPGPAGRADRRPVDPTADARRGRRPLGGRGEPAPGRGPR